MEAIFFSQWGFGIPWDKFTHIQDGLPLFPWVGSVRFSAEDEYFVKMAVQPRIGSEIITYKLKHFYEWRGFTKDQTQSHCAIIREINILLRLQGKPYMQQLLYADWAMPAMLLTEHYGMSLDGYICAYSSVCSERRSLEILLDLAKAVACIMNVALFIAI